MNEKTKQKRAKDPLYPLKYRGYCWSVTEPGGNITYDDFVLYCRFYLAKWSGRLIKDPLIESYTDEEIITEYFAHLYSESKEARQAFETESGMSDEVVDDFHEWSESMMEELRQENEELPDKVSFSPGGGE